MPSQIVLLNCVWASKVISVSDFSILFYIYLQAYLVYKYRGKNNEVQHTTMMSKGGGSRHMYGNKQTTMNTDTLTSNANSFVDKYVEKSANDGESESLLEKDIQVCILIPIHCYTFTYIIVFKICILDQILTELIACNFLKTYLF